jgi:outer membrane protein assembly factor BamB
VKSLGIPHPVSTLLFSGASTSAVHALNVHSGERIWKDAGHDAHVIGMVSAMQEGSPVCYTGSWDDTVRAIRGYDAGEQWQYRRHSDNIEGLSVSTDRSTLFTASHDGEMHALNMQWGSRVWRYVR